MTWLTAVGGRNNPRYEERRFSVTRHAMGTATLVVALIFPSLSVSLVQSGQREGRIVNVEGRIEEKLVDAIQGIDYEAIGAAGIISDAKVTGVDINVIHATDEKGQAIRTLEGKQLRIIGEDKETITSLVGKQAKVRGTLKSKNLLEVLSAQELFRQPAGALPRAGGAVSEQKSSGQPSPPSTVSQNQFMSVCLKLALRGISNDEVEGKLVPITPKNASGEQFYETRFPASFQATVTNTDNLGELELGTIERGGKVMVTILAEKGYVVRITNPATGKSITMTLDAK
jgi:hypothetical protein